jgi:hypothetical protein
MQASVPQARANLSKLLEAVARGEQIVMTRLRIGSLKGQVPPPPADFLAPLSAEELGDWRAL